MHGADLVLLVAYALVLLAVAYPTGLFMARLALPVAGASHWWTAPERGLYRIAGVNRDQGMTWLQYAVGVIMFNALGALVVYGLQRLQASLPLEPGRDGGRHTRTRRSTRRSASSPTPTGRATAASRR